MGVVCGCKDVPQDNVPMTKLPKLLPLDRNRSDSMHDNLNTKI